MRVQAEMKRYRESLVRDARRRKESNRYLDESLKHGMTLRADILASCRHASPQDYAKWLLGYLERGGRITHSYDTPMRPGFAGDWHMAAMDIEIPALYGANAVHIIIPKGIRYSLTDTDGLGHNSLYLMDGYKVVGGWVPCYTNVADILEGWDFITVVREMLEEES